jgi:hypothetical protein
VFTALVALTVAQIGVAGIQLAYNYFAGQKTLAQEKSRIATEKTTAETRIGQQTDFLNKQEALQQKSLASQTQKLDTQYQQAGTDLTQGVASAQAGLAQSGVFGPMAGMVSNQVATDGRNKIDTAYSQASGDISLQRQSN